MGNIYTVPNQDYELLFQTISVLWLFFLLMFHLGV